MPSKKTKTTKKTITNISLVQELLENIGGEDAINLVKICEKKRGKVTDEEIAKKLKKKVTEVRTTLNRLHYRGIACYQKTKNQRTGWYNYTWTVKNNRIAEILTEQQGEKIEKLEQKKELEAEHDFFDCKKCEERVPFEIAAEYQFACPKCGAGMDPRLHLLGSSGCLRRRPRLSRHHREGRAL